MRVESVHEPVEVLVAFRLHRLEPLVFKWDGKKYPITKINLVHAEHDGRDRVHYFSVSGEGAGYRLAYRPLAERWTLEEVFLE